MGKEKKFYHYWDAKTKEYMGIDDEISMDVSNLSFTFGRNVGDDELIVRWSEPGYSPIKPKMPDFDKILFGDDEPEKEEIEVKNIGQRCMKNLVLED